MSWGALNSPRREDVGLGILKKTKAGDINVTPSQVLHLIGGQFRRSAATRSKKVSERKGVKKGWRSMTVKRVGSYLALRRVENLRDLGHFGGALNSDRRGLKKPQQRRGVINLYRREPGPRISGGTSHDNRSLKENLIGCER